MDTAAARYWRTEGDRIICDLCPRECRLKPGQRGACYVRRNVDGRLVLDVYGQVSGFAIDPVEKKPLYHFLPGTSILSFGTLGCNLACRYCQNWRISAATEDRTLSTPIAPDAIARMAVRERCPSIAFTYNDPIPSLEFVVDVARAARACGVRTVAVTNGFIKPEAYPEFFGAMDGANVDLKAMTERFYHRNCAAALAPVLDTLRRIHADGRTWLELTTLIIPGENDQPDELRALVDWIAENLGPNTPLHLSAFHPSYRMLDRPRTPAATLHFARKLAMDRGLRYVYTGNIRDPEGSRTVCPGCAARLILRDGYRTTVAGMGAPGVCARCGCRIPGVWA